MTGVMLALLIGLGIWQLQRLAWKRGILAQIAHAEAAAPVPLPARPDPFAKVSLSGTLRGDLAAFYGADVRDLPSGTVMGAQLIEPLERPGAPPMLVDLGWVPGEHGPPPPQTVRAATVVGFLMPAQKPGWLSAPDNSAGRRFYTLDPARIGTALGLPGEVPYILVAMGSVPPGVTPIPAEHLPRPPNDHFQYAMTWFGLAAVLAGVFYQWSSKVLRDERNRRLRLRL